MMSRRKHMNDKNKELARHLRELAEWIDKDSVVINENNINIRAGHESAPNYNGSVKSEHDGTFTIDIDIDFYDSDKDDRNKLLTSTNKTE